MSIKAIIFDVDGTLADSEPLHIAAWDAALDQYGHSIEADFPDFLTTMAGKKVIDIATAMVEAFALPIAPIELLTQKMALFGSLAEEHLRPTPGAVESVLRFKAAGYRVAVGTSLDREFLTSILRQFQLSDAFEVIVTGDQITYGKPHPQTYLEVCSQLGITPVESVVFEDAPAGVQSAKAAGAWCVAVGQNHLAAQLADGSIETLEDAVRAVGELPPH